MRTLQEKIDKVQESSAATNTKEELEAREKVTRSISELEETVKHSLTIDTYSLASHCQYTNIS